VKLDSSKTYCGRIRDLKESSARGFTLLEVLIAISLLMVVIALAGMAMRLGLNSVTAGEKKIETLERFRSSLNIISSQISSEIPLTDEGSETKKFIFQGSKTRLKLPTGYSIWEGWRGYVVVEYQVIEDDKGKMSMKATENSIGPDKSMSTMLFSGLEHISFSYPGKKDISTGEDKWNDEWEDNKTLPDKIKLNLEYNGKKYSFVMPLKARKISK